MIEWLWRKIEPRVQAAITHRIIAFHDALIERGQVPPPPEPPRVVVGSSADVPSVQSAQRAA